MAKPPIEYRQPRSPASSSGRTPGFESGKRGSSPRVGAKEDPVVAHVLKAMADRASARIKPYKLDDPVSDDIARGMSYTNEGIAAIEELARRRALKAKHMATWRAKQKKLKEQGNG